MTDQPAESSYEPPAELPVDDDSLPFQKDTSFWGMAVTQFLGAFNDNVFKQMVLLLCVAYVAATKAKGDIWQPIAQAAFALPFILFSGYAGYLSDKYSKRTIVVLCKVAEIVVMVCGTLVLTLWQGESFAGVTALCCVLFLMGAQSAFFGPAKYGILPEMLRERDLPTSNGLIQMTTFLAIIFGTVVAGVCMVQFRNSLQAITGICVGIAVLGTLSSLLIKRTPVAQPDLKLSFDSLWINKDLRRLLRQDSLLLKVLLVTTVFWFLGGAVLPGVNSFGEANLKLGEDRTSFMAAMMGIGIAIGCPVAGFLSAGRTRFGMVQLGSVGIALCLGVVGASPFLGLAIATVELVCCFALGLLGFFAGLFAVPLQVFLQARPPKDQKGRMIASMNLVNWVGILIAAVYHGVASSIFGQGSSLSFLVLAVVILPVVFALRGTGESGHE